MGDNTNYHNNLSKSNSRDKQFHRSESVPHITKRIIEMLDHIEQRVELLREHASAMEKEKESLISMLTAVKNNKDLNYCSDGEREEIELTTQRLLKRALTVEVSVSIPRNEIQQKALDNVNKYIEELHIQIKSDLDSGEKILQQYINACLSESKGLIHQKFQSVVLECTADDQKQTRKKLETLMTTLLEEKESK